MKIQTGNGRSRKPAGRECEPEFKGAESSVTFGTMTFEWVNLEGNQR